MKKDVDSTKRGAKEILEILESHNRGYVISENDYKMLKIKYESILKEIDREKKTKVNEKIDFKKNSSKCNKRYNKTQMDYCYRYSNMVGSNSITFLGR